jgi:hypothetical protein
MNTITKSSVLFAILLKVSSACDGATYIQNSDNGYRCIREYSFAHFNNIYDDWKVLLTYGIIPEEAQADCNSDDACMYVYWAGDHLYSCTNGVDSTNNEVSAPQYTRWDKVCPEAPEACSHADKLANCDPSQLNEIRNYYQTQSQC